MKRREVAVQQKSSLWPGARRLLRNAALIDAGILCLAGLICWAIGWRTWFEYGRAVSMGGALCAVAGALSIVGGVGSGNPDNLYIDSLGYASPEEHTRQIALDTYARFRLAFLFILASPVPIVVGAVITQVAIGSMI
jgi:hypothetical protein